MVMQGKENKANEASVHRTMQGLGEEKEINLSSSVEIMPPKFFLQTRPICACVSLPCAPPPRIYASHLREGGLCASMVIACAHWGYLHLDFAVSVSVLVSTRVNSAQLVGNN